MAQKNQTHPLKSLKLLSTSLRSLQSLKKPAVLSKVWKKLKKRVNLRRFFKQRQRQMVKGLILSKINSRCLQSLIQMTQPQIRSRKKKLSIRSPQFHSLMKKLSNRRTIRNKNKWMYRSWLRSHKLIIRFRNQFNLVAVGMKPL